MPRRLLLPAAIIALAGLQLAAFWPGIMVWDAIRQYGQALSGHYDDWHPPAMNWLWRQLGIFDAGPAPMLVVQVALYWLGVGLLAAAMSRRRGAWAGAATLACALLPVPFWLVGTILKDSLMAGALLLATGLLATRTPSDRWHKACAVALLVAAVTLRFNAAAACLPLLIAACPARWTATRPRLIATSAVALVPLLAAMPIANRLLHVKPSGVELSLVIFDLGGITEHSGVDVFPRQLGVADAVRANHQCYRPDKWDSYSDWVDPVCPLGFTAWNERVAPAGVRPYPFWLQAVSAHPIAYAEHRLAHFAINTRLVPIADRVERPVQVEGPPNDWGYHVTPNPVLHAIDTLAVASAHTPLGWPILWIALAWSALVIGWARPVARLSVPLALSAILYGCGYLVFSVAVELRYHLWTELAALLAMVLVAAEWRGASRGRSALAYLPMVIVLVAGLALRI